MTGPDPVERVLTEKELAEALERTYGMAPGHAANLAAWHFGHGHRCMPESAYTASIDDLVKREDP